MFKRQFYNQEHDSGSSSDDDSDEDRLSESTGSSDDSEASGDAGSSGSDGHEGQGESEGGEDSGSEGQGSEEGSEGPESSEDDSIAAEHVIKAWTSDDLEAQQFKGLPLRCNLCDALIINRTAYLNHVAGKKHLRKLAGRPQAQVGKPAIVLASEKQEEEAETHTERYERIHRELAEALAAKEAAKADGRTAKGPIKTEGTGKPEGAVKGKQKTEQTQLAASDNGQAAIGGKERTGEQGLVSQRQQKAPKGAREGAAGAGHQRAVASGKQPQGALQQGFASGAGAGVTASGGGAGAAASDTKAGKKQKGKLGKRQRAAARAQLQEAGSDAAASGKQRKAKRPRPTAAVAGGESGTGAAGDPAVKGEHMNSKARRAAARAAKSQAQPV